MFDHDGSHAYSKIIGIQLDDSNVAYVYSNPVTDHFKISLPGYDGTTGTLKLLNVSGQELLSDAFTVKKGEIGIDLKRSRLEDGTYTIQLEFGGERRQFKIVRTR